MGPVEDSRGRDDRHHGCYGYLKMDDMEDGNYTQVCVMEGVIVHDDQVDEFVSKLTELFGCRFKFLEQFTTLPDREWGEPVPGTGGRSDVLFYVHTDDIGRFAVPRLLYGIHWIEDVFANMDGKNNVYYPERLRSYCSWDGGCDDAPDVGAPEPD